MKNGMRISLLLVALTLSFFTLSAQSAAMTAVDDACKDIVQKNGDLNAILSGVHPGYVDPSVHPNLEALVADLDVMVGEAESGLSSLPAGHPAKAFCGQLSVSFSIFAFHGTNLCGCVSTGDLGGANAMEAVMRDDFQALRLIASDIRAEIQKAKGKN